MSSRMSFDTSVDGRSGNITAQMLLQAVTAAAAFDVNRQYVELVETQDPPGVELTHPRVYSGFNTSIGSGSGDGVFGAMTVLWFKGRNTQTVTQIQNVHTRDIWNPNIDIDPTPPAEPSDLFRVGFYAVDDSYNLTSLLAATANEHASIDSPVTPGLRTWNLTTPFDEVENTQYAVATLFVDSPHETGYNESPELWGAFPGDSADMRTYWGMPPIASRVIVNDGSLTDLPASMLYAALPYSDRAWSHGLVMP